MLNQVPYEVIAAAPIALYTAVADAAKPSLDIAVPLGTYTKVGLSGDLNYDDGAGVQVENSQNLSPWRSMGDSGVRKVFRQNEDCKVKVKVCDMRIEMVALALNNNPVNTVAASAGTMGYKWVGMSRGLQVSTKALLIRLLVSPYGEEWIGQYYFPRAAFSGNATQLWKKTDPVGLELEWMCLVNPNLAAEEYVGRLEFQTADALT